MDKRLESRGTSYRDEAWCVSRRYYITEYGTRLQIKCVLYNWKSDPSLLWGNVIEQVHLSTFTW